MERMVHNQLKTVITAVLASLVMAARTGRFFGDRMMLTNVVVGLSTEPDAMYASTERLRDGRVRLSEGGDSLEVEGTPDMALEVLSPTSVRKDTVVLRDLYWRAEIPEFWLADSRGSIVQFDIFRHTEIGYVATRKQGGWMRSQVFGKSFRLVQRDGEDGLLEYCLEVR